MALRGRAAAAPLLLVVVLLGALTKQATTVTAEAKADAGASTSTGRILSAAARASAALAASAAATHQVPAGGLRLPHRLGGELGDDARSRPHQNPLEAVAVRAVTRALDPAVFVTPDRFDLADGRGEWFDVAWGGVPDPSYEDWVALVVPADADLSRTAPAKWKFAAMSPTHLTDGAGNLRCPCTFGCGQSVGVFERWGVGGKGGRGGRQQLSLLRGKHMCTRTCTHECA